MLYDDIKKQWECRYNMIKVGTRMVDEPKLRYILCVLKNTDLNCMNENNIINIILEHYENKRTTKDCQLFLENYDKTVETLL